MLKVELQAKSLSGQTLQVEGQLAIQFYNENENSLPERVSNERLEVGYIRAKGGEAIGQACELAKD